MLLPELMEVGYSVAPLCRLGGDKDGNEEGGDREVFALLRPPWVVTGSSADSSEDVTPAP